MIKIGIELMRTILKHNPPLIIKKNIGKKGSRKRAGLCPPILDNFSSAFVLFDVSGLFGCLDQAVEFFS